MLSAKLDCGGGAWDQGLHPPSPHAGAGSGSGPEAAPHPEARHDSILTWETDQRTDAEGHPRVSVQARIQTPSQAPGGPPPLPGLQPCAGLALSKMATASSLSLLSSQTAGWAQPCPKDASSSWPHHGGDRMWPPARHTHGVGGQQAARVSRLFLAARGPQARSPCCPLERSDSDSDTQTEGLPCSGRRGPLLVPRTGQGERPGGNPATRPFCWSCSLSFSGHTILSLVITPQQVPRPQGLGCP